MTRRLAAVAALICGVAAAALVVLVALRDFPRGIPVVLCVAAAAAFAWLALLRRGGARALGLAAAVVLIAGAAVLISANDRLLEDVAVIVLSVLAVTFARSAFVLHVDLPAAPRPKRPVLFWNPRSGDGKATRFHLDDEARSRGIDPVELKPGDDLETLVNTAIARGADALAMAGGDGSQAIVARIAAASDLPYACIPAGTRNHFALDLGVDRDDVVGALDAFIDGSERRVDLAEVNGRVFVNNVSLGVYADAVQSDGYREAKLRTILSTVPETREAGNGAAAILVSNNPYRLGRAIGSGTRPSVNGGVLGITVLEGSAPHARRPWREWTAVKYELEYDHPVNAGIDGEAAVLEPPLEFSSRPAALRVRVARQHPGASPSAAIPPTIAGGMRLLARIAMGRDEA